MKNAFRRLLVIVSSGTLAVALLSCSQSHDVGAAGGGSAATVHVRGTAGYSTDAVDIQAGESVTWTWDQGGHSVTSSNFVAGIPGCSPNGQFDSGVLAAGATFTRRFDTPGTYPYFCSVGNHCSASFESAVVVVH